MPFMEVNFKEVVEMVKRRAYRSTDNLWNTLILAKENGLEVTHEELKRIIASSVEILSPSDGFKIERAITGDFIISIW